MTAEPSSSPLGADGPSAGPSRTGTVHRAFGLDAEEFAAVLTLLGQASGPAVADAVKRLDAGAPLGKALGVPPAAIDQLYALAFVAFNAGQTQRAETLFRSLCVLAGDVADHWLGYGICLRLREAFDPARSAFETAARLSPEWVMPPFHLLELSMREGAHDEALRLHRLLSRRAGELPPNAARELDRFRIALERNRPRS